MDDNEIKKFLTDSVNEYYHLEDRFDEVLERSKFRQRPKKPFVIIKKKKFIITTILLSLSVIAAGTCLGIVIGSDGCIDKNSASYIYNESISQAESFLNNNLDNYMQIPLYSYTLDTKCLINFYTGKKDNNKIYVYQIFNKLSSDVSVELTCNSYTKTLNFDKSIPDNLVSTIGILNDSNFVINDNDIMYGNIYVDGILSRSITINF